MTPKKGRNATQDSRFVSLVDQLAGGYKTIGQMVYAVLHEAITTGAFAPGDWLRQESLAEAIGVSRIPVRTALLQLESEGLVTFHPHRGARVRTLSASQIDEIYQLRVLLESYALRVSMARMTPERLATLRELAAKLDGEDDGGDFLETRVRFYREVYDQANNPLLVDIIEDLRGHVGRYLLSIRLHQAHSGRHTVLVERLANGDLMGAEAWLRGHLEQVREGIMALVADSDTEPDEPENPPTARGGGSTTPAKLASALKSAKRKPAVQA
jgi:DNA-binding GntR family transcriptional regulator